MNNIDSDSGRAFEPLPDSPVAAPRAALRKPSALRARLAKILAASGVQAVKEDDSPAYFTFGVEALDKALRGNAAEDGLPRAALHEIHAAGKDDATSAAAMALLLAARCQDGRPERSILWVSESGEARRQGKLYPPGLAELGIDPASILHVDAPDSIAVLRAAAEGVRSSAMGAVIVELAGKKPRGLDLTATRRLSLSAQNSGVPTLLLRSGTTQDNPLPTAAFSRWELSAAPSVALAANAPGHPAFDISLLRHRSGLYGLSARLEWNREYRIFRQISDEPQKEDRQQKNIAAPDAGIVSPLPAVRADHHTTRAA